MLSPDYLATLPDAAVAAIDAMMEAVLQVTAQRVAKYGWTEQSQWEVDRLEAIGCLTSDVQRIIKQYAPEVAEEISLAFEDAMRETVQQDCAIYESAGVWDSDVIDQRAMQNIIRSGLTQTAGTFSNLTATLAKETAVQFAAAMDQAWIAAATGVITPQEAARRAIRQLCRDGIKVVTYPSGHRDTIEVATRRALLTGINQTALKTQDELLLELDCDLVEVTAHAGARPSHAEWQGKVFSRWGKTEGYVTLEAGTGYGTGAGLGGWNCRHSFYPFFEGSTPAYTAEQLADYNAKKYTYDGKELTEYEAMQQQRYFERGIRRWKRECLTAEAMGEDTTEAAVRLKTWRQREADFLAQTGRRRDSSRSQVGGFGRSQASKATWSHRRNTSLKVLTEYQGRATPNKGVILYDADYNVAKHRNEIETAEFILKKFGGDITLLSESKESGEKMPDYIWNKLFWELKNPSTEKASDSAVRKALSQIKTNPGGIILNYGNNDISIDSAIKIIDDRMQRATDIPADIMIIHSGKVVRILRYKK